MLLLFKPQKADSSERLLHNEVSEPNPLSFVQLVRLSVQLTSLGERQHRQEDSVRNPLLFAQLANPTVEHNVKPKFAAQSEKQIRPEASVLNPLLFALLVNPAVWHSRKAPMVYGGTNHPRKMEKPDT